MVGPGSGLPHCVGGRHGGRTNLLDASPDGTAQVVAHDHRFDMENSLRAASAHALADLPPAAVQPQDRVESGAPLPARQRGQGVGHQAAGRTGRIHPRSSSLSSLGWYCHGHKLFRIGLIPHRSLKPTRRTPRPPSLTSSSPSTLDLSAKRSPLRRGVDDPETPHPDHQRLDRWRRSRRAQGSDSPRFRQPPSITPTTRSPPGVSFAPTTMTTQPHPARPGASSSSSPSTPKPSRAPMPRASRRPRPQRSRRSGSRPITSRRCTGTSRGASNASWGGST